MHINPGLADDLRALGAQPWPRLRIIDVGCGRGDLVRALLDLGADAHGVEPDPARCPQGPRFAAAGAAALPFADDSADMVLLNRSLHHVPEAELDGALAEARRVLSPGGALWALEPDPDGTMSLLMEPFHDERAARAAAQQALDRARPSFKEARRFTYRRAYHFPSLAAFRERMLAASPSLDRDAVYSDAVAARFRAGVPREDGEIGFSNPITVRVFQGPL